MPQPEKNSLKDTFTTIEKYINDGWIKLVNEVKNPTIPLQSKELDKLTQTDLTCNCDSVTASSDNCNTVINGGTLNIGSFGTVVPSFQLRSSDNSCSLPTPPPPDPNKPYVPPPKPGGSGIYVFLSKGNYTLNITVEDAPQLNQTVNTEWDFTNFVDVRYPLSIYDDWCDSEGWLDLKECVGLYSGNQYGYFKNYQADPLADALDKADMHWVVFNLLNADTYEDGTVTEIAGNDGTGYQEAICSSDFADVCFGYDAAISLVNGVELNISKSRRITDTINPYAGQSFTAQFSETINREFIIFEWKGYPPGYHPPPPPPPNNNNKDCDCMACNEDLLKAIYAKVSTLPTAIPDGWQIRPEWHRPQVTYQFAQVNSGGTIVGPPAYPITVPHHLPTQPTSPLPNYQKGNWEIIYVLNDNSKVTIHSVDETNGMMMLSAIKPRIDPDYLTGAYLSKSCMVITETPLAQITVKNRLAKYWSQGAKNNLPDWVVKW